VKPVRQLYLAGAISAGRGAAPRLAAIAREVARAGWVVLTTSVLDPAADLADDGPDRARRIFARDMGWLGASDALIAEISVPSLGVGFEIGEALRRGRPTLCLRDAALADVVPSAMIVGNPSPLLAVRHCDEAGIAAVVAEFLAGLASAAG
jgi:2'-deoxynucleoside 5'-phosphate N-hydrolase